MLGPIAEIVALERACQEVAKYANEAGVEQNHIDAFLTSTEALHDAIKEAFAKVLSSAR